jgi:hypothetical protein
VGTEGRPKKDVLVYIQRDLEQLKHTLDKILRPFKTEVKQLREENNSLREGAHAKEREVEAVLLLIAKRHPETLDDALGVLVDPNRRGWKKFRENWRHRLGVG